MAGPLPRRFLPDTAAVEPDGWLSIGGTRVDDLAEEFGTPLFVYDEAHLRARCREAVAAWPDGAAYATKAFLCSAMARLAHEEGMYLDVATGGELHVARHAGVPANRLVVHGNNKSSAELALAVSEGVHRLVIDSFDEIDRLESLGSDDPVDVLVRITPGVEAHTHEFVSTGHDDTKFGFTVSNGSAAAAVERVRRTPGLRFRGVHTHIGSQVFRLESFAEAASIVAGMVLPFGPEEVSVGGGLGVAYVDDEAAPTMGEWAGTVRAAFVEAGYEGPITAEPGRAIVASAAITVYRTGTIKEIPGVRTYVAVDGGMSDNPRPVLYGSGYETFLPRAVGAPRDRGVRVVGKHCESGDLLVREGWVPGDLAVGDLLATPVTGAYGHSMGSNYNKVLRPPVVFVADGSARLVVRRETFEDLVRLDS